MDEPRRPRRAPSPRTLLGLVCLLTLGSGAPAAEDSAEPAAEPPKPAPPPGPGPATPNSSSSSRPTPTRSSTRRTATGTGSSTSWTPTGRTRSTSPARPTWTSCTRRSRPTAPGSPSSPTRGRGRRRSATSTAWTSTAGAHAGRRERPRALLERRRHGDRLPARRVEKFTYTDFATKGIFIYDLKSGEDPAAPERGHPPPLHPQLVARREVVRRHGPRRAWASATRSWPSRPRANGVFDLQPRRLPAGPEPRRKEDRLGSRRLTPSASRDLDLAASPPKATERPERRPERRPDGDLPRRLVARRQVHLPTPSARRRRGRT